MEVVLDVMERIKKAAEEINAMRQDMREKLYYLTFNATVLLFRMCH